MATSVFTDDVGVGFGGLRELQGLVDGVDDDLEQVAVDRLGETCFDW